MYSQGARAANLLGAITLLADGRIRDRIAKPATATGVLAEAVIVLKDQPGSTIDWLGRVLRVSQPGAVHVVKRLVELGWVDKRPGPDARSRHLTLTAKGKSAARRILKARQEALSELVDRLSPQQQAHLADIAETLLRPLPQDGQDLAQLCRLCDRSCCAECPVHEGLVSRQARG